MQEVSINQEDVERETLFFEQHPNLPSKIMPFIWFLIRKTVYMQGTEFKASKPMKLKRSDGSIVYAVRILNFNDPVNLRGPKGLERISSHLYESFLGSCSTLSEVLKQLPLVFYFQAQNKETDELYQVEWRIREFCDNQEKKYSFRIQCVPEIFLTKGNVEIMIPSSESLNNFIIT